MVSLGKRLVLRGWGGESYRKAHNCLNTFQRARRTVKSKEVKDLLAALLMALPLARRYLVAIAISENGNARDFLFRNVISAPSDAFWEYTESGSETSNS